MYTIDILSINDLFNLELINLDEKTETFHFQYYLYYLLNHNEDCLIVRGGNKRVGYLIGKHEGLQENFHAHVTALSIAPSYRNMGIAKELMRLFEVNADINKAYFMDLFVRKGNLPAVNFYKKNEYVVYREIIEYYSNPVENAYDMRKALKMDNEKKSVVPIDKPVHASEIND